MATSGPPNSSIDPLAGLASQIEEARRLPPAPSTYERPADPMARLQATLRGELPGGVEADEAAAPAARSSSASAPGAAEPSTPGSLDALVGREILDLLASRPLPGEDRVEAVERLVVALRNPTSDNVRSVLEVLLRTRS